MPLMPDTKLLTQATSLHCLFIYPCKRCPNLCRIQFDDCLNYFTYKVAGQDNEDKQPNDEQLKQLIELNKQITRTKDNKTPNAKVKLKKLEEQFKTIRGTKYTKEVEILHKEKKGNDNN